MGRGVRSVVACGMRLEALAAVMGLGHGADLCVKMTISLVSYHVDPSRRVQSTCFAYASGKKRRKNLGILSQFISHGA